MSEQAKVITRQEPYEAVWKTPLSAERRVGWNYVHLLLRADGNVFGLKAVAVVVIGHVHAVQDEIGEAEDVGDGFVFPAGAGFLEDSFVVEGADLFLAEINGGAEEAAGAGDGIEDLVAQPGVRSSGP